jgi:hypothetical protein
MRFALASLLAAHGVAHVVGFVSSWKLATLTELPYRTTIFSGRVDVGDAGIRVVGALWLLVAIAFLTAGVAVAAATDWAGRFMLATVIASLLLCVKGLPDARIGVAVNVALLLLVVITRAPQLLWWTASGGGLLVTGYAAVAGTQWVRYGHVTPAGADQRDPLLDRFMPEDEVAERHHVRVAAPAAVTLAAAAEIDLYQSSLVRAIFRAREAVLGAGSETVTLPKGLLAQMTSLGWRVLAEQPGREIVMGAVTQPWLPEVVFRGLDPAEFRDFREPGYVKIVWTLRADPVGSGESMFRTETRVIATDAVARAKFRWYWARFSPGIVLIRRLILGPLRADAERRARAMQPFG